MSSTDEGTFVWSDLEAALEELYDAAPWVPTSAPRQYLRHTCSKECTFVQRGVIHVCSSSGNVHYCTAAHCDQLMSTREFRVCAFTGQTYELDDRILFGYDLADKQRKDGSFTAAGQCTGLYDILLREQELQSSPVSRPGDGELTYLTPKQEPHQETTQPKRRSRKRAAAAAAVVPVDDDASSLTASAAAAATTPTVPASIHASKRPKRSEFEQQVADIQNVAMLARNHLRAFGCRDEDLIQRVADGCRTAWTLATRTQVYQSEQVQYPIHLHVVVVMRFMQSQGLFSGRLHWAPLEPRLSQYYDSPKSFVGSPFNVSTAKFTKAERILRRCMIESAEAQEQ